MNEQKCREYPPVGDLIHWNMQSDGWKIGRVISICNACFGIFLVSDVNHTHKLDALHLYDEGVRWKRFTSSDKFYIGDQELPKPSKCECGSDKCGLPHSNWCPKYQA